MSRTFVMHDTPFVWLQVSEWARDNNLGVNKKEGDLCYASAVYKGNVPYQGGTAFYVNVPKDELLADFKAKFKDQIIYDRD